MTIYDKILELCKSKGIDKTTLEKECGFSQNSINKWKNSTPSVDRIIKVANYFNISTDYLLGLTDESNTFSVNANTSTELIKRPKYTVSDKFMEDYTNLLNDKHFANIAKVYNEFDESYKIQVYTYIVALATQVGLNVANIIKK